MLEIAPIHRTAKVASVWLGFKKKLSDKLSDTVGLIFTDSN